MKDHLKIISIEKEKNIYGVFDIIYIKIISKFESNRNTRKVCVYMRAREREI